MRKVAYIVRSTNQKQPIQYTLRGIPEETDTALRRIASRSGSSLNSTLVRVLNSIAGTSQGEQRFHDLDAVAGTWVHDSAFDEAMAAFDLVDEGLWEVNLLLDTNRYRDFCENEPAAVDLIQRALTISMPFVVLAELRAGFRCGTLARRNEKSLTIFLNSDRVRILFADEATTHHFADVFAQLRLQGTPIPVNDIWIAALTIQHDLILFSRDGHFDVIPQLARA